MCCGIRVLLPCGLWDLPRPGVEPGSPALAGRFFTTDPPGKPAIMNIRASLIAQLVKNLPAMQETPAQFLGQEDLLEKGWATHSSILGLPLWLNW